MVISGDYYARGFPKSADPEGILACTFYAVLHNKRALTKREHDRIVAAAIFHGLMQRAPFDEVGVRVCQHYRTKRIEHSRTGVIVTPKGQKYWRLSVRPNIPEHIGDLGYGEKLSYKQSKNYDCNELLRRRKP